MSSLEQTKKIIDECKRGISAMIRPVPQTASEWADNNFYLSSESSYHEGKWVTIPFQRPILNSMGSDEIAVIDFIKSARVGYSKMMLAIIGYMAEHKKRNQMLWQPTDGAAKDFMKAQIDTMIRDVPVVLRLSPWYGMKHKDNTNENKTFANRKQLYVKGGKSAKNYREKSVDVVYYDELSSFEPNVEKEGSPTSLGDKRVEGSTFRKSIRGSTPKIKGDCLISLEAETAPHLFRRQVPCPHCGEHQVLKFGDKSTPYGFKWDKNKPETVFYQCEHNGCVITNDQLSWMDENGHYESESGLVTVDGLVFRYKGSGEIALTPKRLAYHIWTAYSPWTTWAQIVSDWLEAQGDSDKIKTFKNTTLGEAWEDERGERIEPEGLSARAENYNAEDVIEGKILTAGIDTQDNRLEATVYAFDESGECWGIEHIIAPGDTAKDDVYDELFNDLADMGVSIACQDAMGHNTDTVYRNCKKRSWVIPIRGVGGPRAFVEGRRARAKRLRRRKNNQVIPEPLGVDQGKSKLHSRLATVAPGPNYIHFNNDPSFDSEFYEQITAEVLKKRRRGGRVETVWTPLRERNEALDCWIYAYAAFLIYQTSGVAGRKMVTRPKGVKRKAKKTRSSNTGQLF